MNVRSLLLLVGALGLFAPTAFAQNEDQKAGARSAADEGGKAFEAGKFSESLDLFTRAESLVHALPHLLFIARSHEKLGQLVKAREAYLKMTREKLADGAPDAFKDAQTKAQTELQSLEPRIPKVTISLKGDGAASAKVQMDGAEVPAALVGIPHPVDPGQHTFSASGEGVKSEEKSVDVKEGSAETVELELKAASDAGGAAAGGGEGSATLDPAKATKGANGLRIASYAALGVGVVGLVVGTVFALSSKSKRDDASALCNNPNGSCPPEKRNEIQSLDDDADSAKTFATVGFVVGGVGIAAGVTMFILSGKKKSEPAAMHMKPRVTPWVGLGSAGVSGRF